MLRYLAAAGLIAAAFAGLALELNGTSRDAASVETDSAVLVDLPAAEASSRAATDAAEGPEQSAAAAQAAAPDAAPPKPPDTTKPDPVDLPPTPERPAELATPSTPAVTEPPPQPAVEAAQPATASAAREETAPAGSPTPEVAATDGGEAHPRPSAHAITLWQQALMKRLESARRQFSANAGPGGTVTIGFVIGERGELLAEHVAASSGSRTLDAMALQLVKRAAPFPTPPAGSRDNDLSFTVPVRFR